MEKIERTLFLIKPQGMKWMSEILAMILRPELKIIGVKIVVPSKRKIARHYAEHRGKGRYLGLIAQLACRPVLAMVLKGENAVALLRDIIGPTDIRIAPSHTIRGCYCTDTYAAADKEGRPTETLVHGSATAEAAEYEIPIWFKPEELISKTE